MIRLEIAEEGTFAMTGPDDEDYAVLRFANCPIYVIASCSDSEGKCFIHGIYKSYIRACDALMNYCLGNKDMYQTDDVTDILVNAEYEFPTTMRLMADYFDAVYGYGG